MSRFDVGVENYFGRFAENKEEAIRFRDRYLIPAVDEGKNILLNFANVETSSHPMELLGGAMESTSLEAPAKPSPHYLVKIQRDDDFVGRENVMDRLNTLLSSKSTHNRVALVALGGVGLVFLRYGLRQNYALIIR